MKPITPAAMEKVLSFLAPLFQLGTGDDPDAARQAAAETLAGYHPRTEQEVRLAALIIAFGLRALDALSRAAEPGLDVKIVLRLNSSAQALHRAAAQCEKTLARLRAADPIHHDDPIPLPDSAEPEVLRGFIRTVREGLPAQPSLSRQQRREAERRAEKLRQRNQQAAHRTQREAAMA